VPDQLGKRVLTRWLVVALSLWMFPGLVAAQDGTFAVTVAAAASGALAYGDPIVLTVRIKPTAKQLEFSEMELVPLGDLAAIYRAPGDGQPTCRWRSPELVQLGSVGVATCELVPVEHNSLWRPKSWFVAPGSQHILVKISVVEKAKPIPYYEEVPIVFRAPLPAIFMGGLAGALLLAIFTAVKVHVTTPLDVVVIKDWPTFLNAARLLGNWLLNLVPRIWKLLMQTIMGGICAIILILLAQSTEGLSPPIAIKIQDFWGGVVIGLFSIPLSRWIWAKVREE